VIDYQGKEYAEAYKKYIDKHFRKGMTAQEFFDAFCDNAPMYWNMCVDNWQPTLFYRWNKPVKDYRIKEYDAEEGMKIGIGHSGFFCIEFRI
jgi:hypothetical protein